MKRYTEGVEDTQQVKKIFNGGEEKPMENCCFPPLFSLIVPQDKDQLKCANI